MALLMPLFSRAMQVLGPGGTGKIMEHLSGFLGGRPPEQKAFLKSRGILKG